jgi:hypothetical protein
MAELRQKVAAASQKITCPGKMAGPSAVTVAVKAIALPAAIEVTTPPFDVKVRAVDVAVAAEATSDPEIPAAQLNTSNCLRKGRARWVSFKQARRDCGESDALPKWTVCIAIGLREPRFSGG